LGKKQKKDHKVLGIPRFLSGIVPRDLGSKPKKFLDFGIRRIKKKASINIVQPG